MQNLYILISILGAVVILWWLLRDMKRQREWREAKELKIAQTKRRIAQKKKQAAQSEEE